MTDKTSIGDRMKAYEDAYRWKFSPRSPLIIRIDGRCFHSYTKGLEKPWDNNIQEAFLSSSKDLFKEVQGIKIIYIQSDELSALITDYDGLKTIPWFNKNIQKIVSVSSSIVTAAFNKFMWHKSITNKSAYFDSRAFLLPKEEVTNYFIWRQRDAIKNSISMLAQRNLCRKEIHKKDSTKMLEMLVEKGIDWSSLENWKKKGFCVSSKNISYENENGQFIRTSVDPDWNVPEFSKNKNYIEKFVYLNNENKNI